MSENMNNTNIFYRIPGHRGTRIATFPCERVSLNQFRDYISAAEGLPDEIYTISHGTRLFSKGKKSSASNCDAGITSEQIKLTLEEEIPVAKSYYLTNNSSVDILFSLKGGKGGFGSLLRAIGAQIEKTTNRDACRDLSGRRLRDVKREQDLRKLLALQAKLKQEKAKRRREKLERLKKNYLDDEHSLDVNLDHGRVMYMADKFDDPEYNKIRSDMPSNINAACEAGLKNMHKRMKIIKEEEEEANVDNHNDATSSFEDLVREARQILAETSDVSNDDKETDVESLCTSSKECAGDNNVDTNAVTNLDTNIMSPSSHHSNKKESVSVATDLTAKAKKKPNVIHNLWLGIDDSDDEDDEDEDKGDHDDADKKTIVEQFPT